MMFTFSINMMIITILNSKRKLQSKKKIKIFLKKNIKKKKFYLL